MRIDSNGRTLIGTSFTNGYSLEIFTSLGARVGSNGKLSINASGNVEVDASGVVGGRFIINSSGNVGIANSSPGTYRLNINGTGFLNASAWVYSSDRRIKNNILDISDNNVGYKAATAIALAIKTNTTLSTLILKNTKMRSCDAITIAKAWEKNSTLTLIDISNNDV
jgi:hypothetical protein